MCSRSGGRSGGRADGRAGGRSDGRADGRTGGRSARSVSQSLPKVSPKLPQSFPKASPKLPQSFPKASPKALQIWSDSPPTSPEARQRPTEPNSSKNAKMLQLAPSENWPKVNFRPDCIRFRGLQMLLGSFDRSFFQSVRLKNVSFVFMNYWLLARGIFVATFSQRR